MKLLRKLFFLISLPLLRIWLRPSHRAYVLVRAGNKLLMVKPWLGRGNWLLPGGGCKRGEPSRQAALRELKHETGLDLSDDTLTETSSGYWQTDRLGFAYKIYKAELEAIRPVRGRRPEIIEAKWISATDLTDQNCPVEILTIING